MKIGILVDTHLTVHDSYSSLDPESRLSIRTMDKLKSIKSALEISKKEGVRLFVFAGDIFDKMDPPERLKDAFYQKILPFTKYMKIVILPGNHDGAQTHHSFLSEQSILDFTSEVNLIIHDKPRIVAEGNQYLLYIPWTTELDLSKLVDSSYNKKEIIVVGHIELEGAQTSTEISIGKGVSPDYFKDFKMSMFGHYHMTQFLRSNVCYIGSSNIIDFSEREHKKGFAIYNTEQYIKPITFYELEQRRFLQYVFTPETLDEVIDHLEEFTPPVGSVIKLRLIGTKEWVNNLWPQLVEAFEEFKPLKIIPDIIRVKSNEQEIKYEEITQGVNRIERIKNYCKDKPEEYSDIGIQIFEQAQGIS